MVKLRLIIGILVVIGVLGGTIAGVHAQEEGLVAEWHFDEGEGSVLKDSSGNGNDGVIYGATWVDGKYGGALEFDGVDDYLKITSNDFKLQPLSVGLWVKSTDNDRGVIIKFENGNAYFGWAINIDNSFAVFNLINNIGVPLATVTSNKIINDNKWHHIELTDDGKILNLYVDGVLSGSSGSNTPQWDSSMFTYLGAGRPEKKSYGWFIGVIDEVRIYNRALSLEEIKQHYESGPTSLSITKTASPQSIKQGQNTTITLTVKNTGSTEISDIEIADIIPSYLIFDGETSKTYNSLAPKDTRQISYTLQFNDAGTFNLEPAIATYADDKGNYNTVKSKPESIEVIRSIIENSATTPKPTNGNVQSASVNLHGEKTDVTLGEDVLLKLSAVNIIGNPTMHVQVIIIPPSGWSVTSSEFAKSGAGQYTTTYELESGGGKDIEVRIVPNQVGDDFQVDGRIIYYFGDDIGSREDHTLTLPITVRAEAEPDPEPDEVPSTPGFAGMSAVVGLLATTGLVKRNKM